MRAVFLDRDGVINRMIENGYVLKWEDFEFLPGVDQAISYLNTKNIPVIVISNQACVGKGLISMEGLKAINDRMLQELGSKSASILDVYVCPHVEKDNCDCRKPKPGLLIRAAREHGIDLKSSIFIGDSDSDVEAGKRAGCATYLLKKGEELLPVVKRLIH